LCQRYFINTIIAGARTAVSSGTGAGSWATATFPATMRATPTVTASFSTGSSFATNYTSISSVVCSGTSDASGNWAATLTASIEL
jgi:hypothetical protein